MLAIYSIVSEWGSEWLLHKTRHKAPFLMPMLESFYSQLMLLGLFSFLLFSANRSGLMQKVGEELFHLEKHGEVSIL